MRHGERFVRVHQCLYVIRNTVRKILVGNLYAAVPVVLCYAFVAFNDVACSIYSSVLRIIEEFVATAFALYDAIAYRAFWSERSWFVVVVDEVAHRRVFTTISSTVNPVVDDVVHEVEHASPSDRRVAASVVSPEVAHERRVLSTNC